MYPPFPTAPISGMAPPCHYFIDTRRGGMVFKRVSRKGESMKKEREIVRMGKSMSEFMKIVAEQWDAGPWAEKYGSIFSVVLGKIEDSPASDSGLREACVNVVAVTSPMVESCHDAVRKAVYESIERLYGKMASEVKVNIAFLGNSTIQ
jgi:hypothetical protein